MSIRNLLLYSGVALITVFSSQVQADTNPAVRPDTHAPVSVMGDHIHKKGEWMMSYRYMYMDMNQHYSGTKQLSVSEVHNDYIVSPVRMKMDMHMLGVMYGVTDDFTIMGMLPYITKDMEHRRRTDHRQFSTRSQGVGDVKLSGMLSTKQFVGQNSHVNFGVSFPTGSINAKDRNLLGPDRDLPYPMQLGSGTFDFLPGFTLYEVYDEWSWGFQAMSTVRFGRNEHKYRLGNQHNFTSWIARQWADWISTSFRVNAKMWENIRGRDRRLNLILINTADPNLQGGERIDVLFGINLVGQEGFLHDHRFAFEVGLPVYQDLDGPQLGVGIQGTFGWQKAF